MPDTRTSFEQTLEFHLALGLPVGDAPATISDERLHLRLALIGEEVAELVAALSGLGVVQTEFLRKRLVAMFVGYARVGGGGRDLAAIAKEAIDVHVVTSGTLVEYGIPEDDVASEVHRSNMAKAGGPRRIDGKALKPPGWVAPDVAAVLERAA